MAYIGNPIDYEAYILNMGQGLFNLVLGYGNDERGIPGGIADANLTFVMVCDCGSDHALARPYVQNSLNFFIGIIRRRAQNEVRFISQGKKSYSDYINTSGVFSYNALIDVLIFSHTDDDHINKFYDLFSSQCDAYCPTDWIGINNIGEYESSYSGRNFNTNWIYAAPKVNDIMFKYEIFSEKSFSYEIKSQNIFAFGINKYILYYDYELKANKYNRQADRKCVLRFTAAETSNIYNQCALLVERNNHSINFNFSFPKDIEHPSPLSIFNKMDFNISFVYRFYDPSVYISVKYGRVNRSHDSLDINDGLIDILAAAGSFKGIDTVIIDILQRALACIEAYEGFESLKVPEEHKGIIKELLLIASHNNTKTIINSFVPDDNEDISYHTTYDTVMAMYSQSVPAYIREYTWLSTEGLSAYELLPIPAPICVHDYYKPKFKYENGALFISPKAVTDIEVTAVVVRDLLYGAKEEINNNITIWLHPDIISQRYYCYRGIYDETNSSGSDQNRYSFIVKVSLNNRVSVLLPGDATVHSLLLCTDKKIGEECTVLCAPHHGAYVTSRGKIDGDDPFQILHEYLNMVKAKFHIICAGYYNSYSHPAEDYVKKAMDRMYYTNTDHNITCCPVFPPKTHIEKRTDKNTYSNTSAFLSDKEPLFNPIFAVTASYDLLKYRYTKLFFNYFKISQNNVYVCDAVPLDGELNKPQHEFPVPIVSRSETIPQIESAVHKLHKIRIYKPFKFEHNGASLWK